MSTSTHKAKPVLIVEGIVRGLAWSRGCRVVCVEPQQSKIAVGDTGNASKAQVVRAVKTLQRGCEETLSEHAADALARAIASARRVRVDGSRVVAS